MSGMGRKALMLPLVLLLVGLACNLTPATVNPDTAATAMANALVGTLAAGQTSTAAVLAAAGTLASGQVSPVASATPSPGSSPTATLTATPAATATQPVPMASLTQNTNCRGGPLAVYDLIRTILIGESAQIAGKNAAGDYWYVTDPNQPGKDCWLWGRYVTVSGDTSAIPVFTPPPTPTPSYDWSGDWSVWVNHNPADMTLVQSGGSVTGTLSDTTDTYDVSGTTSDGGRTLSGSITSLAPPLAFAFRMTGDMQQFQGHYTGSGETFPWCGARGNASQPLPCLWP
jgi:hypothetical protein